LAISRERNTIRKTCAQRLFEDRGSALNRCWTTMTAIAVQIEMRGRREKLAEKDEIPHRPGRATAYFT
jgi:hypothetical protein